MLARGASNRGARRQTTIAAAGVAIIAMFVVGTALPAWAHHPVLAGDTTCSNGVHLITWTIGNSESDHSMHIDTAVATLGADTFAVSGYAPNVGGSGSTSALTTVPGGLTGTVTITVHATWDDNVTATRSATVTLSSACTGPTTTTTTIGGGTTTTTIGGGTTTTTGESTTSTTIGGGTTTTTIGGGTTTTTIGGDTTTTTIGGETSTTGGGATTTTSGTPVGPEGSTSSTVTANSGSTPTSASPVTAAGNNSGGSLPFTGGSSSGPIFGVVSLAAGALALTLARRRNHPRDS
jgi:hypothetical protein